jgi:hypothetical protein
VKLIKLKEWNHNTKNKMLNFKLKTSRNLRFRFTTPCSVQWRVLSEGQKIGQGLSVLHPSFKVQWLVAISNLLKNIKKKEKEIRYSPMKYIYFSVEADKLIGLFYNAESQYMDPKPLH